MSPGRLTGILGSLLMTGVLCPLSSVSAEPAARELRLAPPYDFDSHTSASAAPKPVAEASADVQAHDQGVILETSTRIAEVRSRIGPVGATARAEAFAWINVPPFGAASALRLRVDFKYDVDHTMEGAALSLSDTSLPLVRGYAWPTDEQSDQREQVEWTFYANNADDYEGVGRLEMAWEPQCHQGAFAVGFEVPSWATWPPVAEAEVGTRSIAASIDIVEAVVHSEPGPCIDSDDSSSPS